MRLYGEINKTRFINFTVGLSPALKRKKKKNSLLKNVLVEKTVNQPLKIQYAIRISFISNNFK